MPTVSSAIWTPIASQSKTMLKTSHLSLNQY